METATKQRDDRGPLISRTGFTNDGDHKELNDIESTLMFRIEESCLAHLVEEKETLLRTGVYLPDDPIIIELEKQINEVMTRMKR